MPDAWILVERVGEAGKVTFPVLLEIDRGTMYRQRFKRHVRSRIEFVRSGVYEKVFGTRAVMIVYATTGRELNMEARRRALVEWTREVLEEMRRPWGAMFRFCGVSFAKLYETFRGVRLVQAGSGGASGRTVRGVGLEKKAIAAACRLLPLWRGVRLCSGAALVLG